IFSQKGMGESTGKKVWEILQTGKLEVLEKIIAATPPGIIEMMNIKGIGPKKIHTIWKEMQLESLGELLYACEENRLLLYKGFGAKTQQNVMEAIRFYNSNRDNFLFAEVENYGLQVNGILREAFPGELISFSGEFRRQCEIIRRIDWVTTIPEEKLSALLAEHQLERTDSAPPMYLYKGAHHVALGFIVTQKEDFFRHLFENSCSSEFLLEWKNRFPIKTEKNEEDYFSVNDLHFIPACLREQADIIDVAAGPLPNLIQPSDIKGIIHSHSTWSDGSNSIEEMAVACMAKGLEYLVISDHSKSAFYANGLNEERIAAQQQQIEELNKKLAPFRIFKSIECDILNDGSLDYSNDVLASFDLVITSVHSNLKMTEEKAMARLLKAIENPYTTILGHMTGRLLLSRPGYPVDHARIIDACKANNVAIELNAHPRRLDMDWRFIRKAISQGVMISIDPDAHAIDGYDDNRYGVLAAQKGALSKEQNLSSFSLADFEAFIAKKKI
ncbi:MAG TPA: PHP domain-containing protein, partial [Chitinophagaceae bacterium]|nr:PHP domain-containing protein [Chitinophagaceae bacterium]